MYTPTQEIFDEIIAGAIEHANATTDSDPDPERDTVAARQALALDDEELPDAWCSLVIKYVDNALRGATCPYGSSGCSFPNICVACLNDAHGECP